MTYIKNLLFEEFEPLTVGSDLYYSIILTALMYRLL